MSMHLPDKRFANRLGTTLVVLQFGCILLLAGWAAPAFLAGQVPMGAWFSTVLGVLLGAWALSSNRLGNFNIRPVPREGGTLVQQGPYRWIRHPMYSAVIACGLACAWTSATWGAWLVLALLVVVLVVKAAFEERWMVAAHPGYAGYRLHTKRFLPWIV
ncbi:isoprenylcysteine carboxylmethyltransferase family protein [Hydrogenophaga sp.]|uniref:methyltransferase family protein n=1 Tax=Hydrogenophaga sp. TaxID=1904254 RepID=UPI00271F14C1|nr:methyltransferase [Hydrogenophaga sp.]MDO8906119.1 methyltransferase [Hydrogenophaga sp.]